MFVCFTACLSLSLCAPACKYVHVYGQIRLQHMVGEAILRDLAQSAAILQFQTLHPLSTRRSMNVPRGHIQTTAMLRLSTRKSNRQTGKDGETLILHFDHND